MVSMHSKPGGKCWNCHDSATHMLSSPGGSAWGMCEKHGKYWLENIPTYSLLTLTPSVQDAEADTW